ncbi:hypothetical protein [Xanthomonas euvesicatoria]|uniref:hypothetical protein n=1 Tax=Xanthomonas euvesicatoria TaxID=456327 RepID=UPI000F8DEE83|nr:hypothetical protein [Xanthomonas euvesicatoria]
MSAEISSVSGERQFGPVRIAWLFKAGGLECYVRIYWNHQLIVRETLGPKRLELNFAIRTETDFTQRVSGTLSLDAESSMLSIARLRYAGAAAEINDDLGSYRPFLPSPPVSVDDIQEDMVSEVDEPFPFQYLRNMSKITLINQTDETVRLALFQKPVKNPTLATIAWQIVAPPPGGSSSVEIPSDFSVQARYSNDPTNPSNLDTSTRPVSFSETSASFSIDGLVSQDRRANRAVINQTFTNLVLNEVRVVNNFSIGAETTIYRGGDAIYEAQVIWPGGLFLEDVRSSMYVAVISQFTYKGQRLVQEELSLTETEVLEGGTLIVTGSMWTGYSLNAA